VACPWLKVPTGQITRRSACKLCHYSRNLSKIFYLRFEYFIGVQSPELHNTKFYVWRVLVAPKRARTLVNFLSCKSAPANEKKGIFTSHLPKNEEIKGIFSKKKFDLFSRIQNINLKF
jgi:hypothetical protein